MDNLIEYIRNIIIEGWNDIVNFTSLLINYFHNTEIVANFIMTKWNWNILPSYLTGIIISLFPLVLGIAIIILPGFLIGLLIKKIIEIITDGRL